MLTMAYSVLCPLLQDCTAFMTSKTLITKCWQSDGNGLYVCQILLVFKIVMLQKIRKNTDASRK